MSTMNDLNAYQYLNSVLRRIVNEAAMGAAYDKWSDDFARNEVRTAWSDTKGIMTTPWERRVTVDELRDLTEDEFYSLGFMLWEDGQRLIPLWAFNYIADGEEFTSIMGSKVIKGQDDIDLDVRFGCIAFYFTVDT